MRFPNPLLRAFVDKATYKSFDKGLFLGVFMGTIVTHLYERDEYKKLQIKYYSMKTQLIEQRYFKQ